MSSDGARAHFAQRRAGRGIDHGEAALRHRIDVLAVDEMPCLVAHARGARLPIAGASRKPGSCAVLPIRCVEAGQAIIVNFLAIGRRPVERQHRDARRQLLPKPGDRRSDRSRRRRLIAEVDHAALHGFGQRERRARRASEPRRAARYCIARAAAPRPAHAYSRAGAPASARERPASPAESTPRRDAAAAIDSVR